MASLYSNAATFHSAYVSSHSKEPLLVHSSTGVSNSKLSMFRRHHSQNIYVSSTTVIQCSIHDHHDTKKYIPSRRISDPKRVLIFDTTLRDGEQAPGAAMTPPEKLDIARQLAKLRVDLIEAGFPASSDADYEVVKSIASEVGNNVDDQGYVPVISAIARCTKGDIDRAWDALKNAKKPMLVLFIATSDIHLKYKLQMSREQAVEKARSMVAYAKSLAGEEDVVGFGAEDAGRTDREFLYHILGEVIKAGATLIAFADTVGSNLPSEHAQVVADLKANVLGIENVDIAVHCHNDLGLATANTLAGICAGARVASVTINGIGERAGNAALEEVVMALKYHGGQALGGLYTGINTQHIFAASKMVEEYTGLKVHSYKAIVGANAFSHESGIHQDGVLKNRSTYEFMSPEDIGFQRANESGIVLGRLSGRHALQSKMLELGYEIEQKDFEDLFWQFKSMAEKKKKITDDDLIALVSNEQITELPKI